MYVVIRRFLFVLILSVCSNYLQASEFVRHWSDKDGLSHREVHYCVSDRFGYLWVATANGLNRFDGYHFWQPAKYGLRLPSDKITWLLEQHDTLWIGTDNGIALLNLWNYEILAVFQHSSAQGSLHDNYVTGIRKAWDQSVWVTTGQGYVHRYTGHGHFQLIKGLSAIAGGFGIRLHMTEDSNAIWIKSEDRGLFRLRKDGQLLQYDPHIGPLHIGSVRFIPGAGTFTFDKDGIRKFEHASSTWKKVMQEAGSDAYDMFIDGTGKYWLINGDSRHILRKMDTAWEDKSDVVFGQSDLVHVREVVAGQLHSFWLCSNNGLYLVSSEKDLFTSVLRREQMSIPGYVASFRGIMQDDGGVVYAGGYSGVFKSSDLRNWKRITRPEDNLAPYVLFDLHTDEMLAATEGFGLVTIHKQSGKIRKVFTNQLARDNHRYQYLTSCIGDTDGTFWVGGYQGLFQYTPRTGQVTESTLISEGFDLGKLMIRALYRDSKNRIWISTQKGIFLLSAQRKPLMRFHTGATAHLMLPENMVNAVYESSDGTFWFATSGGGLVHWNEAAARTEVISKSNGLADDNIVSVLEDKERKLWIATNFGMSLLEEQSGRIQNFYIEDGLADNEFNSASALRLRDGRLIFGGVNGLSVCTPGMTLTELPVQHTLQFSRLKILGADDAFRELFSPAEIHRGIDLEYNNRYLEVDFFISDFLRSEKNAFQYQLKGYDNHWIRLGEQHNLRFVSLPAGNYTLHLRGSDSRGVPAQNSNSLPVMVHEVFYLQSWFILLMVALMVALVYIFQLSRIRKLKQINDLRARLASDLHDDVGSVLTRIAMQAELMESELSGVSQSRASSIMQSCRNALGNMRDLIWSIDSRNLHTGNLIDKLHELALLVFESNGCHPELIVEDAVRHIPLTVLQKQEIYFLLKEAMHNALKHGDSRMVELRIRHVPGKLTFELINSFQTTGPVRRSTGQGLRNMQMRADRIHAHFHTENKGEMHYMILTMPLKKSKLNIE